MIDWTARIDHLTGILARDYDIDDRMAAEVLLSCLIDCPRTPVPWIIMETHWFGRDCLDGWFSFGGTWTPEAMQRLRAASTYHGRMRAVEDEVSAWLDTPSDPHLFIESFWEKYPYFSDITNALELLHRSLRLRCLAKKTNNALRAVDLQADERRYNQLGSAADLVISDRVQARGDGPPAFRQPADFLYHLETMQRLSPWFRDWGVLVKYFGALAVRHAHLYGREETGPEENRMMARIAMDSVPFWILQVVNILKQHKCPVRELEVAMCLDDRSRRTGHGAYAELQRLRKGGIIEYDCVKQRWGLVPEHRDAVIAIAEERAFGAPALAAAS